MARGPFFFSSHNSVCNIGSMQTHKHSLLFSGHCWRYDSKMIPVCLSLRTCPMSPPRLQCAYSSLRMMESHLPHQPFQDNLTIAIFSALRLTLSIVFFIVHIVHCLIHIWNQTDLLTNFWIFFWSEVFQCNYTNYRTFITDLVTF